MPIYEYECKDCGKEFEKLMGFSDPDINAPECPGCKSRQTHRRISKVASYGGSSSSGNAGSGCNSTGSFG